MSDLSEFRLPDVGEGLTEATIVRWLVEVGEHVALNHGLVEVETAKSVVELPSPFEGVVENLLVSEGAEVAVGTPIIVIRNAHQGHSDDAIGPDRGSDISSDDEVAKKAATGLKHDQDRNAGDGPERSETDDPKILVGQMPRPELPLQRRRPRRRQHAPAHGSELDTPKGDKGIVTSPLVRRMAQDRSVDLATIEGTGVGGRITRRDVENADVPSQVTAPASGEIHEQSVTRSPASRVRRATAKQMARSAAVPQASVWTTIDISEARRFVKATTAESSPAEISLFSYICMCVVYGLTVEPSLNAQWDSQTEEILSFSRVDLNVAVASEHGLLVPCLQSADAISVESFHQRLSQLVMRARSGEPKPEDLKSGTFTVTNIGATSDVACGTPLLNPPQSGILAIGRARRQPMEYHGSITLRDVLDVSLTVDHRIVDGAEAGNFLDAVSRSLSQPTDFLLSLATNSAVRN